MPLQLPRQFQRIAFSTTARILTNLPTQFHSYHPQTATLQVNPSKLGRIGRWYLPTMAAIAVGTLYLPADLISTKSSSSSLDSANRQVGIAIASGLQEYNMRHLNQKEKDGMQRERNEALLEAYGERLSLADVERALEVYEAQ
ncbi:hypothetical protein K469DRAFT_685761 [Zopfia rhizophila CBS 207.26]|uniref:Uncharacterized protein n=1 Tax=Zopfia rhizophila CBS 207.26 TaxID=1314779 RepID=A0A6A6EBM1_9PEZI|nr:hypothetical protein K469DRAFT_685761 [Zopfia rhizophila CBS 207.26]